LNEPDNGRKRKAAAWAGQNAWMATRNGATFAAVLYAWQYITEGSASAQKMNTEMMERRMQTIERWILKHEDTVQPVMREFTDFKAAITARLEAIDDKQTEIQDDVKRLLRRGRGD